MTTPTPEERAREALEKAARDFATCIEFPEGKDYAAASRNLRKAAIALAALSPATGGEERGWLIEHGQVPKWLTLNSADAFIGIVFTADSNDALRFARRQDAELYVHIFLDDADIRITEHAWGLVAARSSPVATGGETPPQAGAVREAIVAVIEPRMVDAALGGHFNLRAQRCADAILRLLPEQGWRAPEGWERSLAVEIVDGLHGFTCEFNTNPAQHIAEYDTVEWAIKSYVSRSAPPAPTGEG